MKNFVIDVLLLFLQCKKHLQGSLQLAGNIHYCKNHVHTYLHDVMPPSHEVTAHPAAEILQFT